MEIKIEQLIQENQKLNLIIQKLSEKPEKKEN